tara:strand:+ start:1015 stop:1137 length:123 start_codon:yes stop_codon:yes gene_type:complete
MVVVVGITYEVDTITNNYKQHQGRKEMKQAHTIIRYNVII